MTATNAGTRRGTWRLVDAKRLSHAYIFVGNRFSDKNGEAREFAKAAHCSADSARPCGHCLSCQKIDHGNHEDLIYLRCEKNSIGVKQIEELLTRLRNKPFASDRLIAIIEDADRMTVQSQNKLLKTLEEPNPGVIIILVSENLERLLPTIRSRCVVLRVDTEIEHVADPLIEHVLELSNKILNGGAYYEMTKLLDVAAPDKETGYALLNALESVFRERLIADVADLTAGKGAIAWNAGFYVDKIESARRDLNSDVSCKYALRNMIIELTP
jgi:DNA polymerase-3 subunit delta'